MTRAKFVLSSKTEFVTGFALTLNTVTADNPENKEFFRWTPSGELKMQVVNPEVAEKFEVGKSYYVDFTLAE